MADAVHTLGVALARTFPLKNTAECCAALQSCSLAAAHSHTPARAAASACGCAEHVISCSALACTRFTHLQVRIGPRSSGSVVSYIGVYRPGENVVLSTASSTVLGSRQSVHPAARHIGCHLGRAPCLPAARELSAATHLTAIAGNELLERGLQLPKRAKSPV